MLEAVLDKRYLVGCNLAEAISMYAEQAHCAQPVVLSVSIQH